MNESKSTNGTDENRNKDETPVGIATRLAHELQRRSGFLEAWSNKDKQCEIPHEGDWRRAVLETIKTWKLGGYELEFAAAEVKAFLASLLESDEPEPPQEATNRHRTRQLVDSFLRQHLVYYFVERSDASGTSPDNTGDPAIRADRVYADWFKWLEREVVSFFDATILEIVTHQRLEGRPTIEAYTKSLLAALGDPDNMKGMTTADVVPAHGQLETLLLFASKLQRENLLWDFIRDWKHIVRAVFYLLDNRTANRLSPRAELAASKEREEPKKTEEPKSEASNDSKKHKDEWSSKLLAKWILQLLGAPVGKEDKALLKWLLRNRPSGEELWFFDPDRLERVVQAMRHILFRARWKNTDVPPAREVDAELFRTSADLDRESAEAIDEARRLFLSTCLGLQSSDGLKNVEYWRGRSKLERIWWRSFQFQDVQVKDFQAKDIAAFCYGETYARWNASGIDSEVDRVWAPRKEEPKAQVWKEGDRLSAVVFGAGIAGLTAAHELAERGFLVTVVEAQSSFADIKSNAEGFEANVQVGGLARTQWESPKTESDSKGGARRREAPRPYPGEHGYRLFPSFYRHLFDTMKRTPVLENPNASDPPGPRPPTPTGMYPTAFDQLQPTIRDIFARRSHYVPVSRTRARSLEAFRQEYIAMVQGLEFEPRDMARFFFKLVRYLMTCSERRAKEYEGMSLLQFLGGAGFYSPTFLQAIQSAPKALVAMDAERCDARTQCNVYLQLLLDQVLGGEHVDRTLRGPTSTAWFIPWRRYLQEKDLLNVRFVNAELLTLRFTDPGATANGHRFYEDVTRSMDLVLRLPPGGDQATFEKGEAGRAISNANYYVVALDAVSAERVTEGWESEGVPSEIDGFTTNVQLELPAPIEKYVVSIVFPAGGVAKPIAERELRSLLTRISDEPNNPSASLARQAAFRLPFQVAGTLEPIADMVRELRVTFAFQCKVPEETAEVIFETLQSWVPGRVLRWASYAQEVAKPECVTTPRLAPNSYGETPRDRFQTFTGVQFYFKEDFKLVRGHVYFPDSEWGLSAISQSQFWWQNAKALPGGIRGVLSVDIGNTRKKSSYTGMSFVESDPYEIKREVWRQVEDGLRTTRGPTSIITSLPLPKPVHAHVDENLVFSGAYLRENRTPFLINNVGDWDRRPRCEPWVPGRSKFVDPPRADGIDVWQSPHGGYRVHDKKVVFCGTYMRTFTRMTTMEAANESARHAVNAILDYEAEFFGDGTAEPNRPRATGDYCSIWDPEQHELDDMEFFKRVDEMLFKAGKPHLADILQFDKIADLRYPDLTSGQALATALGATLAKDWGVQPSDVMASVNGLLEVARGMVKDLGLAGMCGESPAAKILSALGLAKGIGSPTRPG